VVAIAIVGGLIALRTPAVTGALQASPVAASPVATGDGSRTNPAQMGQSVRLSGMTVTLLAAEVVPPGTYLVDPDPGMAYLALDVRIDNANPDPISYGPDHFDAKDIDQGYEFTNTAGSMFADLRLNSGELAVGDFVRGMVVIDIKADSRRLLVRFTTEPYGEGLEGFWLVTLS